MDRLIEIEKEINSSEEIKELLLLLHLTMRSWCFNHWREPYVTFYFYCAVYDCGVGSVNCVDFIDHMCIKHYLLRRYIKLLNGQQY